jgi:hypothetical protein
MKTIFHANRKRMPLDAYYVRVYLRDGTPSYAVHYSRNERESCSHIRYPYDQSSIYHINVYPKKPWLTP